MDKFGIFNLLGSLINQNNQSADKSIEQTDSKKDTLSTLISSLLQSKNTTPPQSENKPADNKILPPLNSKMLSTMSSHDEFIKRVQSRAQKV